MSFSSPMQRSIDQNHVGTMLDEETCAPSPGLSERPIPSALGTSGEAPNTPLPVLPLIVLSIVMLGEFLSANVATPFLFSMVEGFGTLHGEADVGYWTGIAVSCFFITQFLTSLLWATIAEKHGARTVLFASLMGSSLTCLAFGTSTSLAQLIVIRLLQGIFAGAIGVARGNIAVISDSTNEGRAYAILGFCWGLGGIAGAIIGGSFETPARKWPNAFQDKSLFVRYPYLLPTVIASTVTFSGAIMSLFLARDGGPKEGAIHLPPEKLTRNPTIEEEPDLFSEEEEPLSMAHKLRLKAPQWLCGCFARHVHDAHIDASSGQSTVISRVPMTSSVSTTRGRIVSSSSRPNGGSAYGYSASFRNRVANNGSHILGDGRGSLASTVARRRGDMAVGAYPTSVTEGNEPSFAQRLLIANELAVTNIADLWVAAAMNVDNEDSFETDTDDEFDEEHAYTFDDDDLPTRSWAASSPRTISSPGIRPSRSPHSSHASYRFSRISSPRHPSTHQSFSSTFSTSRFPYDRQVSPTSGAFRRLSMNVPTIFSHVGVRSPSITIEQGQQLHSRALVETTNDGLQSIVESGVGSARHSIESVHTEEMASEKQSSPIMQLPLLIIMQYGLLALHSTTHDQVFLSYLVSKYATGGLNLNPAHFAQLIALMSLAQIVYQFYLYPNLGPPRGRFSHLAMFRLGSFLFIPSYLTVILYRPLASVDESGNGVLMAALAVSNAIRFCASCFSYTAIAILLNYTAPPQLLGLANGIAQSIVSLARFVGPILGGLIWSISVDGNPSGYPLGFIFCAGVASMSIAMSFLIR